jgi:chorismate lyase/3-hydroxybenzoate synthase
MPDSHSESLSLSMTMRSSFSLHYLHSAAVSALSAANGDSILGVIGYGADRPASLPELCPFARADLPPIDGVPVFEVWTAPTPATYRTAGPIHGAISDDLVFGLVELDQKPGVAFQSAVSRAYVGIFDFLNETGFRVPIRFWNYLPKIIGDENGLERYRRFNIGRYDAFSARLLLPVPPVASAVGGQGGSPLIYFLGARKAAKTIENPRQVSAYNYPPIYGPRSPRFSRASIAQSNGVSSLMISGTASIVGHETRHHDDPAAQIAETLENISAIIQSAGQEAFGPRVGRWALKAYIRDPALLDIVRTAVDRMFGADCERIFLHADMCRPELLMEIEALCSTGD